MTEENDVLDVHPPHSAVHGWRDFFIHIATITIGLLIALGLEGAVEALHHRHIVREARADIRRELERNAGEAKKDARFTAEGEARMEANLVTARDMRDHPGSTRKHSLTFNGSWSGFRSAAWRTARDTGALSYMAPDEVERYSDMYEQQEILDKQGIELFLHQGDLLAPVMVEADVAKARPEELAELMRGTAVTSVRLHVLGQLLQQLETQYADTLKQ